MRLPNMVIALTAAAAPAGCGTTAGTTPKAEADTAPAASGAKADETCVKFLRFPADTVVWTNRREQLRDLEWAERHVRVAAQAGPRGDARQVIGQLEQAQRVRRSGARADAVRDDARRAYEDFFQRYRDAAIDSTLERCVEEQAVMDEQEAKFTRSANAICEDAIARMKRLRSDASMHEYDAELRKYERLTDQLDALTPPVSERPLWDQATAGLKAYTSAQNEVVDAIGEMLLGGADESTLRDSLEAERRAERGMRRADRAFRGLYLRDCADIG